MGSTYSNLKIQLMATGENATTWGNVTNVNLGTALEEAIANTAVVTFASANETLTLTDTNASQSGRRLRIRCAGTTGGSTRTLTVPTVEKPLIVLNGCSNSITVKTAAQVTGITVPAGKTMWLYIDGTDVVDTITHLQSLTLASGLAVSSGGTGQNSYTNGQLLIGNSSGNTLAKGTLTAGSGINVTNGAGSITIVAENVTTLSSSATIGTYAVGYRDLPQISGGTGYTLTLTDGNKHVLMTSGTVTVPNNTSVALGIGTLVSVVAGSSSVGIAGATGVTLRLAGSSTTGSRTLSAYGVATLFKTATNTWYVSGAGVT